MFANRLTPSSVLLFVAGIFFVPLPLRAVAAGDQELCDHSLADPDAGIPACTRLLDHPGEGTNVPAYYNNRGVAKVRKGDLDSAIQDFNSALDRNPRYADAFKNRGIARQMQSDYDGAIADFTRALGVDRKSPELYNARGSALFSKGEYDRAIADFDTAISLDSKYAKAYVNRGLAFHFTRRLDRAIADFGAFVRLASNDPLGHINRAAARMDKADFKNAIADYNEAIRLDPKNAGAYTRRGEAWRLQGDLERSLADHNKAIGLNANEEAYNNRALTLKDRGQLDKAIADCDEAILLQPKSYLAYATRGLIRRLKGDLRGSLADLNKAVELNPRSPIALTFRGDALREAGDDDRAMKDFNEAILILPDFVAAYTGRGLTYEKRSDPAKAKADFEKALSLSADLDAGLARPAREVARTRLAELAAAEARRAKEAVERAAKEASEARAKAEAEEPIPDPGVRVALIIGNSAYRGEAALPNPRRDARAVEAAFRKIGFQTVVAAMDVTRQELLVALRAFEEKAELADWAVIYYAGHGIEVGRVNYLIPVDAKLSADKDVEDEAVSLDRLLHGLEGPKRLRLRLVILDACRDNPFSRRMRRTMASRSVGRGLAPVEPDAGTFVVYATRDGETAEDGAGEHSPFAQAFLNNVIKPRVEIDMLFRRVRAEVMNATNRRQEPFTYGSLPPDKFYFVTK